METKPRSEWKCARCGWRAGTKRPAASDACDSCGGELICAECAEPVEFCECDEG